MISVHKNKKCAGFILLTSSIILSAVLVAVVLSVSFSGFFTRLNLQDSYRKEASYMLAESCAEIAVQKLIQDRTYAGDEFVQVGTDICRIRSVVTVSSGSAKIEATASVSGAVTNIEVRFDPNDMQISRWREVPVFSL